MSPNRPGGPRFYARDGSEITLEQWSALLGDIEYKRVALTRIGDEIRVSTVWLGLDYHINFGGEPGGPVAIFETMVFGGPRDQQEQWRYGDEASALDGHARIVEEVRVEYQLSLPDAARPVRVEDE